MGKVGEGSSGLPDGQSHAFEKWRDSFRRVEGVEGVSCFEQRLPDGTIIGRVWVSQGQEPRPGTEDRDNPLPSHEPAHPGLAETAEPNLPKNLGMSSFVVKSSTPGVPDARFWVNRSKPSSDNSV